jgi:hypothetical protein
MLSSVVKECPFVEHGLQIEELLKLVDGLNPLLCHIDINDGHTKYQLPIPCWNSQGPSGARGSSYVCRTTTGQVDWCKRVGNP